MVIIDYPLKKEVVLVKGKNEPQKEIAELMTEIIVITMEIRDRFPEVYIHLDETPLFGSANQEELDSSDFEEYLNTIRSQLKEIGGRSKKNLIE